jgi:hypothetical protein
MQGIVLNFESFIVGIIKGSFTNVVVTLKTLQIAVNVCMYELLSKLGF